MEEITVDLGNFETNLDLEVEGIWHDVDDSTRIKVAREGNKKHRQALQRLYKPFEKSAKYKKASEEQAAGIIAEAMAEGILVDWEGMSEKGKPLPYSKENAKRILEDEKLKDFRNYVMELARDADLYRREKIEETEKK